MDEIIHSLPVGTFLRGPKNTYRIQQALGQGTFGITYLATTEMTVSGQMGSFTTTVKVAVKEFFMKDFNGRDGSEVTASSQGNYFVDYKRKFLREAETLARLQHPNIVKVLESFEANNTAYYAMEYLDGGSLDSYIEHHGALTESQALPLIQQIGSALACMHNHRMLHLDLKPGNVMLRSSGEAVLIDFGLSKHFDKNGEPESSTSLGGGTAGYAPLEQTNYQRGDGLPATMDIYAFGATIYKMLTGERPPEASDVLNDGLPTFVLEQKGVPDAIIDVIERAMSPMRKRRYQTVKQVLEAIRGESEPSQKDPTSHSKPPTSSEETTIPQQPQPNIKPRRKPFWQLVPHGVVYGVCSVVILACFAFLIANYLNGNGKEELRDDVQLNDNDEVENSQTFTANGVSFKMIRVDGGTFTMGATSEQGSDAWDEEKPAHQVTLCSYYIGETEVTQALWEAVMGSNPSNFKGSNRPVEQVSWDDCQTFIRKLNSLTGKSFRLPTEAEWEFASRGGTKSQGYKYSGSNNLATVAWFDGNSGNETHPVKTKSPNELGIYDMSGNVCEWCQDWYGNYSSTSQRDPMGASSGSRRVRRGGSWYFSARLCRVSYRGSYTPDFRFDLLGLRLVL